MTHEAWIELFAKIVIVDIVLIVLIDVGSEYGIKMALRLKWSLLWYILQYSGMGSALAVVIDALRR